MFGKPVVAGDNGGMRVLVEEGGNGYLVPPGDPDALRRAIATLAASPIQRRAFGDRSRQLFEERFSVERMIDSTVELYRRLTDSPSSMERVGISGRRETPSGIRTQ